MTDKLVYDVYLPSDQLGKVCRLFGARAKKQHRGFYLIVDEVTLDEALKVSRCPSKIHRTIQTRGSAPYVHIQVYKEAP